jgi:hypothetical protein
MERGIVAIALLLLGGAPLLAQDAVQDRHPIAPDNAWSITDSDCSIDVGYGDDVGVSITPHDDHHDFGLYDPAMKGLVDQKVVPITFTAGGTKLAGPYEALGHKNAETTSYVANVDRALLDAVAASQDLQVHRGRTMLADLDLTGITAAIEAMRACELQVLAKAMDEDANADAAFFN